VVTLFAPFLLCALGAATDPATSRSSTTAPPVGRIYVPGEVVVYELKIRHEGRDKPRVTEATSSAVVKEDSGIFYEATHWLSLKVDGIPVNVTRLPFEQQVSLDGKFKIGQHFPDLSRAPHELAGPITELLTYYSDLQLASRPGRLVKPSDHVLVPYGRPSSWANPRAGILIGEDCIDFDLALVSADNSAKTATITVAHVPPKALCVSLPAAWMRDPIVPGRQNNWTQVIKVDDHKFIAAAGLETFTVELNLKEGRIISAKDDNPVEVSERVCSDDTLTACGPPVRYRIVRTAELRAIQPTARAR
jgi:hypothetical protein